MDDDACDADVGDCCDGGGDCCDDDLMTMMHIDRSCLVEGECSSLTSTLREDN